MDKKTEKALEKEAQTIDSILDENQVEDTHIGFQRIGMMSGKFDSENLTTKLFLILMKRDANRIKSILDERGYKKTTVTKLNIDRKTFIPDNEKIKSAVNNSSNAVAYYEKII